MNGEALLLALALALHVLGIVAQGVVQGWSDVGWSRYPVFLPTGLLALCFVNRWLRSRVLGWSVFTLAFLCLLMVLGAFVIRARVVPNTQWLLYGRALLMYGALGMAGLFQLRSSRPSPPA